MARKKLQDYNKEELLHVLEQKDYEIRKLKDALKAKDKEYRQLQRHCDKISAQNLQMREDADKGFINSVERTELENKASLNWHFYQYQKSYSELYVTKFHELQAKYNLLLSRLENEDADPFEGIFQSDYDWKNCEKKRIELQAQNESKDLTIQLLQETLDASQKEIARLQNKTRENPRAAGRKAVSIEVQEAIRSIRNTPKEDGAFPTIREIAAILGISTGSVAKYLKNDQ